MQCVLSTVSMWLLHGPQSLLNLVSAKYPVLPGLYLFTPKIGATASTQRITMRLRCGPVPGLLNRCCRCLWAVIINISMVSISVYTTK